MRLVISLVETEDGSELISLYRWLTSDAAVAERIQVAVEAMDGRHADMGGAFDAISAMFADGSAAAAIGSLLLAYRTWRDTRHAPPALKIEKDGVTVLVTSDSEQEMRRVLQLILGGTSEERRAESGGEVGAADGTSAARPG